MKYPVDFTDKVQLGKVFSWQTRVGLAPKSGSCSIAEYQQQQCAAIKEIERLLIQNGITSSRGADIKYHHERRGLQRRIYQRVS